MVRTLVFDLDDTISICHDRNWESAKPVLDVIRKINVLYNQGWRIVIDSSRGQLSGTNYFNQVTDWLNDNGVLYHELRFSKRLAALYVDDKAVSPRDFVNMDIFKIESFSGSDVYKIGNKIHKTDKNIKDTIHWYETAGEVFYVPRILGVSGDELILQYIDSSRKTTVADCLKLTKLFKELPPITSYTWKHYIDRIQKHCDTIKTMTDYSLHMVVRFLHGCSEPENTFSHGDLNPDNVIIGRKELMYLIDPICSTYSSYKLDEAKVEAWSLRQDIIAKGANTSTIPDVSLLAIAETIRTIPYIIKKDTKLGNDLCLTCLNFLWNLNLKGSE